MEKKDKIFLVFCSFFFVFLYAVLTTPPTIQGPDIIARPLPHGCMVYSMSFQSALNARAVLDERCYWSDIIGIKFKDQDLYHAVVAYEYAGRTWIYDCNIGSFEISSKRLSNIKEIVDSAYPDAEIEDAIWLRSDLDHHDHYGFPE